MAAALLTPARRRIGDLLRGMPKTRGEIADALGVDKIDLIDDLDCELFEQTVPGRPASSWRLSAVGRRAMANG